MTTRYKNPWYNPRRNSSYDPEYYETDAKPKEYKGYLIYERIPGQVWDIVKDGVCVGQMAGPNGARQRVDELTGTPAPEKIHINELLLKKG